MKITAALLAGLLLLGATAIPASATIFGASQSVCILPATAASNMASSGITPDDPEGTANCAALCAKWIPACQGAVRVARSCFNGAIAKIAIVRSAACDAIADAATRGFCKDGLASDKKAAKTSLDVNADNGESFCEGTGFAACMAQCS